MIYQILNFIHMNSKKTRRARFHGKSRSLQRNWPTGKYVPWLNVNGVWLEQAGFRVGDAVEITVENNMLTIKTWAFMEIQEIKSRLSLSQVLQHYGLKQTRTCDCTAPSMMIRRLPCRCTTKRIHATASAVIAKCMARILQ